MFVFLDVLEHVIVGVDDDEALAEDVDDGSDVEVLRSVVGRRLRQTAGPRHTAPIEVLAAAEARVADRRLVDRQRVVGQGVDEDKAPTPLFLPWVFLTSSPAPPPSLLDYLTEYSSTLHSTSRRALGITGCHQLLYNQREIFGFYLTGLLFPRGGPPKKNFGGQFKEFSQAKRRPISSVKTLKETQNTDDNQPLDRILSSFTN